MNEGERDSFACASRPVRQKGFLLYKFGKQVFYIIAVYLYLDGIRCSWIITIKKITFIFKATATVTFLHVSYTNKERKEEYIQFEAYK